jgi:3-oxoacyl-[acyl-carrier protein] reductase
MALAKQGASILLLSRREHVLKEVAASLPKGDHKILAMDLGDRASLSEILDRHLAESPIEIFINNSAGPPGGALLPALEEDLSQAFANHILAANLIVSRILPGMKERAYGRVVNIISTSVKTPIPSLGASNTVRAAVANWAKTLSFELAPFGVTVNNVLPGYTETPRLQALVESAAIRLGKSEDEIRKLWQDRVPLGRFAQASEVAAAVAFLASSAASYVNGINFPVDGGRTASL